MKNKSIEAYRFIFSLVIALYHLRAQIGKNFFESGYTIVEFFFILSGFLTALSLTKRIDQFDEIDCVQETIRFMGRKIKNLYPHYLLSLLFCWIINICFLNTFTLKTAIKKGWTEILMIQMTGLNNNSFTGNSADWYVSALVIASFICGFLILKHRKCFLFVLAPIIYTSIYVYLYREFGHLGTVRGYRLNMLTGTMRAVAGLSLGCTCFCVYRYISSNYSHTNLSKWLFTCVDLVCIGVIFYRIFADWKTALDFIMLPVYSVLIISTFLQASYLSDLLDNKITQALGGISYAIFLNHTVIRDIFKHVEMETAPRIALYLSVIIILSFITTKVIKVLSKTKLINSPLALIFKEISN